MGIIENIAVDDETMRKLQADARKHGRSIEAEAAEWLKLGSSRLSRAEIIARFEAIAAMTPKDVKQTDSSVLIREDRDR
jgi:plasmid stability protein